MRIDAILFCAVVRMFVAIADNATREKAGQERAKLFLATGVFFCHVLRIRSFVCDEIARAHTGHDSQSSSAVLYQLKLEE